MKYSSCSHAYRARARPSTPAAPAAPIAMAVWIGAPESAVVLEAEAESEAEDESEGEDPDDSEEEAEAALPDAVDEPVDDPVAVAWLEAAVVETTSEAVLKLLSSLWTLEGRLVYQSGYRPLAALLTSDA